MPRTFLSKRCELCSLQATPDQRLCPACSQMIERLLAIAGRPSASAADAPAPRAIPDQERAQRLYERSLDLDIFSVAVPGSVDRRD